MRAKNLVDEVLTTGATTSKIESMLAQVNGRLSPALMDHYARDYTACSSDSISGMDILEKLQKLKSKLELCQERGSQFVLRV